MRAGIIVIGLLFMIFASGLLFIVTPVTIWEGNRESGVQAILLSFILGPIGFIMFIAGLVMMNPLKKKLLKQQLQS